MAGKKKQKYYVVWAGHNIGVFDSWSQCQKEIKNYPGALYKSFKTEQQALDAFEKGYEGYRESISKSKPIPSLHEFEHEIEWNSISVDAAWNSVAKDMEYRGVDTRTGFEIFRQGPFADATNNVGEFLALVHALALCQKKEYKNIPVVYSDSRTAMSWVRDHKVRTTLKRTNKNKIIFELINRALIWLKKNKIEPKILKWDTKRWGEIPADFGRK